MVLPWHFKDHIIKREQEFLKNGGKLIFPFPDIDNSQIKCLEEHVFNILDQREKHSEKTIGEMYDPDIMPKSLLKAHQELDLYVDKCYRSNPFNSDDERLKYLFKLYENIINKDKLKEANK